MNGLWALIWVGAVRCFVANAENVVHMRSSNPWNEEVNRYNEKYPTQVHLFQL